ncbi:MAG: alkaline phosphatase family protein [Solirubrobacteraceae bacterium]
MGRGPFRRTHRNVMARRVLVIGLDCAAPQLVFERWLDELPALRALTRRGSYGLLRSCDPPITVPAWACMTSSRDPGALGVYGFRNRPAHDSYGLVLADSRAIAQPRLWDILSGRGRPTVAVGVPPTWPVQAIDGAMVSCFMAPGTRDHQYTHPAALGAELDALVGEYLVDVPFRTEDKDRLLSDLEEMTDRRFRVAQHLIETRPWDLFFLVEIGTDRVHHGFWRFTDPAHRRYERGNRYEDAMLGYYRGVDRRLGELVERAGDDTAVLVVSDHGAMPMDGGVCVNEWLRREGYLVLHDEPSSPRPLRPEDVDWRRTTAWGEGGYYCRVFVNVAGRERHGIVAPAALDRVCDELRDGLEAIGDDRGRPMPEPTVAHPGEELYARRAGVCPDLLVYFGGLHWRSVGLVGTGALHRLDNDTGPDDANHAPDGLYILAADGVAPGRAPRRSLLDVAPTILALLGEPVPGAMQGTALL